MEKTQEQVKTNQENIKASATEPKQEESKKSMTMSEIWAKTAQSYWDMMIWKQPESPVAESPYIPKIFRNGTATKTRNAWNMSINICKSLSMAMIDPNMVESLFKVTDEMPETLLKMQRKELDRMFKWNSEMIGKTENVEKLMSLMYIKNFK
jgi:hypothetical protein